MLKYKICVLFLSIISIATVSFFTVSANKLPLFGKVIYLDAGHGGLDPGALYKSIKEKDINLKIVYTLKQKLEENGATVYLTRYGDYDLSVPNAMNRKRSDLSRRANMINDSMCDMYISIHLNAESSSSWSGAQVFYDDVNKENERLAKIIQNEFRNIRKDIRKISYATFLLELSEQVMRQNNNPEIYTLLISSLEKLEEGFDASTITSILELKYLDYHHI